MKASKKAVQAAIEFDIESTKKWLREKRGYTAQEARLMVGEALREDLAPDYRGIVQAAYDVDFPEEKK